MYPIIGTCSECGEKEVWVMDYLCKDCFKKKDKDE